MAQAWDARTGFTSPVQRGRHAHGHGASFDNTAAVWDAVWGKKLGEAAAPK